MSSELYEKVSNENILIRVNKKIAHFWKPPAYQFPTGEAFRPSQRDKEKRDGHPSGVSVFDQDLTSIYEAKLIRMANNPELIEKELGALLISVQKVEDIAEEYEYQAIVLYDLIREGPAVGLAGAGGHAVISGIIQKSKSKMEKKKYKAMLDDLACSAAV